MAERKVCCYCAREGHRAHACPNRPRERDIEARLVASVAAAGGIAYKFTSPGRRHVPDRLVVLPAGSAFFVELKAPGKQATAGQRREHAKLRALGQFVFVADSYAAVDALMEQA